MQKAVVTIQGVEIPLLVRHEDKGFLECEIVASVDLGDGITVHPGALIRIPSKGMDIQVGKRSYAIYHGKSEPKLV